MFCCPYVYVISRREIQKSFILGDSWKRITEANASCIKVKFTAHCHPNKQYD